MQLVGENAKVTKLSAKTRPHRLPSTDRETWIKESKKTSTPRKELEDSSFYLVSLLRRRFQVNIWIYPDFSAEVGNYCFSRTRSSLFQATNEPWPDTLTPAQPCGYKWSIMNSEVVGIKNKFSIRLGNYNPDIKLQIHVCLATDNSQNIWSIGDGRQVNLETGRLARQADGSSSPYPWAIVWWYWPLWWLQKSSRKVKASFLCPLTTRKNLLLLDVFRVLSLNVKQD